MSFLLEQQRHFDEAKFDQDEWRLDHWADQKTRHISLHIAKAALKLCGHGPAIVDEVIPDLSIYRAQLINTHKLSVDVCLDVDQRRDDTTGVVEEVVLGNGELAYYLEPAEHGVNTESVRLQRVGAAVRHLHIAAESLGAIHGVDVNEAHQERMRLLLDTQCDILPLRQK